MELRYYLGMLGRGWWILLLTAVAAIGGAIAAVLVTPASYQVNTRFIISPDPQYIQLDDRVYSLDALNRRSIISTFAEILNSRSILETARQELNLNPADLALYKASTVVLPDANVLELFVEGPNPILGVQIANSIARQAVTQVKELYQVYDMTILDPPVVPDSPVRPQPARDILLAGVLGLGLGAGLALLRGVLFSNVRVLQQANLFDRESGTWSRSYFLQRLEEETLQSPGSALSVGLLYLPGLQDLSSSTPPVIYQNILKRVTGMLRAELRGKDLIARWSDSGFIVLFPSTPEASAYHTMQIVQQGLSRPQDLGAGSDETIQLRPQTRVISRDTNETTTQLLERAEQFYRKP